MYNTNGTIRQEFNLKDHASASLSTGLGNPRVVYSVENGVVTTRQIDNYYPFGYNIKGLSVNKYATTRPNEYLYNGKMMQDEMGLNLLDYGARMYDAVLGRWHSLDQLEQYESGFIYCGNNPIFRIDPTGNYAYDFYISAISKSVIDPRGQIIYNDPNSLDKHIYQSDGKSGRDGNTNGLLVVGIEEPGVDYSVGRYVNFNFDKSFNFTTNFYYPSEIGIEKDYTIEEIILTYFTGYYIYKYVIKQILHKMSTRQVREFLEKTVKANKTKGPSKQHTKTGNYETAKKDFESLKPKNVKEIDTRFGKGKTGTLPDGTKVTVRPGSKEGSPTIEIRNPINNRGYEIRYK